MVAARQDSDSTSVGAKQEDEGTATVLTRNGKEDVRTAPVVQAPSLPLRAISLASCVTTDSSNKTPTMTPHTLTDIALKKSEHLLAELAALGLTLEEDDKAAVTHGETEPEPEDDQSSGNEHDFCLDATPTSSLVVANRGQKRADTVEVPVVLLDLFSETLSKYHALVASPQNNAKPEAEIPIAKTRLADTVSPSASTTDDSLSGLGAYSLAGSITTPRESSSNLGSRSMPLPSTSTFKAHGYPQPCSPRMHRHAWVNPSIAQANIQLHQPQVQMQGSIAAPVKVEIPYGCRSCTIQQTFTVTSTVHVTFPVDV